MDTFKVGVNCDTEKTPLIPGTIKACLFVALKKIADSPDVPLKLEYGLGRSGRQITDQQAKTGLSQVAVKFGFKYSTYYDRDAGCRFIICGAVPVRPKSQSPRPDRLTHIKLDSRSAAKARRIGKGDAHEGVWLAVKAYPEDEEE